MKEQIRKVCQEEYYVCGEDDELGGPWMEKVNTFKLHNSSLNTIFFFILLNKYCLHAYIVLYGGNLDTKGITLNWLIFLL